MVTRACWDDAPKASQVISAVRASESATVPFSAELGALALTEAGEIRVASRGWSLAASACEDMARIAAMFSGTTIASWWTPRKRYASPSSTLTESRQTTAS